MCLKIAFGAIALPFTVVVALPGRTRAALAPAHPPSLAGRRRSDPRAAVAVARARVV
jgi:hypothetical protein